MKCKEKGIQLIHIFEDEWINKQEIVKSIIKNKLGLTETKIYARKCLIKNINNKEATDFLNDNHVQGRINGKHVGLYFKDELVSILTIGKTRFNKKYEYEILRFCNKINTNTIGGFSKLLKYVIKNHSICSLITYADIRYSDGKLYNSSGFNQLNKSTPNYFYLDKNYNSRLSRIQFQKHKLKNLLESFDPKLTEWQNMQLNGYDRIWDCGNLVYEYNF